MLAGIEPEVLPVPLLDIFCELTISASATVKVIANPTQRMLASELQRRYTRFHIGAPIMGTPMAFSSLSFTTPYLFCLWLAYRFSSLQHNP